MPRSYLSASLDIPSIVVGWGQGYASEAARCVFDYARDVLRLPRVISVIHPENVRSLRLAQRFGVQREDVVEVLSRPLVRFVWPISVVGADSVLV